MTNAKPEYCSRRRRADWRRSVPPSLSRRWLRRDRLSSLRSAIAQAEARAGTVSAVPLSEALAKAIERHKAAIAAFATCGNRDAAIDAAGVAERAARWELATLPCESVEEFLAKLRYLLEDERRACGEIAFFEDYGCVVVAVDAHFNPANYKEEA